MTHDERIILIGRLFYKYHFELNTKEGSLEAKVVHHILCKLTNGENPILEGLYMVYDMPGPYDANLNQIWEYLEKLAKDANTTPLLYAAKYASTSLGAANYQVLSLMITNIVYQRMSEQILIEIEEEYKKEK